MVSSQRPDANERTRMSEFLEMTSFTMIGGRSQRMSIQQAHHYVQRILEDFYDHRVEVEATLRAAKRIPPAPPVP